RLGSPPAWRGIAGLLPTSSAMAPRCLRVKKAVGVGNHHGAWQPAWSGRWGVSARVDPREPLPDQLAAEIRRAQATLACQSDQPARVGPVNFDSYLGMGRVAPQFCHPLSLLV